MSIRSIVATFLLALVSLSAGTQAQAGTATVTFVPATQYTDGTVIPTALLAPTSAKWSLCAAGGVMSTTILGEQAATSTTATSIVINSPTLVDGNYCFQAFTNLTSGLKSTASNTAAKIVPPVDHGPPKPPTISTVTTVAYEYRPESGKLLVVGYVLEGTECGTTLPSDARYAGLNRGQVTITRNRYKGGQLYGRCS